MRERTNFEDHQMTMDGEAAKAAGPRRIAPGWYEVDHERMQREDEYQEARMGAYDDCDCGGDEE